MLVAENINKSFGDNSILQDLSVSVVPGAATMVIGPSGVGKTTLLRILSLLDAPDSGQICLDELEFQFPDYQKQNPKIPWPKVSVVFQQLFLWPHLTIRKNISLPLRCELDEAHLELCQKFAITETLDRYPNQASVGERQRAALVRALLLNPKYLLLDEITAALDAKQTHEVLNHLLSLNQIEIGLFVVSHNLNFVEKMLEKGNNNQFLFLGRGYFEIGKLKDFVSPKSAELAEFLSPWKDATER